MIDCIQFIKMQIQILSVLRRDLSEFRIINNGNVRGQVLEIYQPIA